MILKIGFRDLTNVVETLKLTDSEWEYVDDPTMLSKSWDASLLKSSESKLSRKSCLTVIGAGPMKHIS